MWGDYCRSVQHEAVVTGCKTKENSAVNLACHAGNKRSEVLHSGTSLG